MTTNAAASPPVTTVRHGLEIVILTGMSGSGKSVALRALEDSGYYCVDNLPPELLQPFIALEHTRHGNRVAVAMDVRSGDALPLVPQALQDWHSKGITVHSVFLDATTDTLVRRFSETRRRHPLSNDDLHTGRKALMQVIDLEREMLGDLREHSHVIDTSTLAASQLQSYLKKLIAVPPGQLTLVFQSFAFKRGIPVDADYVFDVRMLPNPYYEHALRPLTGLDEPVKDYLYRQPEAHLMQRHIEDFLNHWLQYLARNHRSYVTVAVGCTGGQHRSVYLTEALAHTFSQHWMTLTRHRELDQRTPAAPH